MERTPRILVIEDSHADVLLIETILESAGIPFGNVLSFCEGESAERFITARQRAFQPDVILLDLHLRLRNGFELLELLARSDLNRVPVIVMSATLNPEEIVRARKYTPHFFPKPIQLEEFSKITGLIRKVLADSVVSWQTGAKTDPMNRITVHGRSIAVTSSSSGGEGGTQVILSPQVGQDGQERGLTDQEWNSVSDAVTRYCEESLPAGTNVFPGHQQMRIEVPNSGISQVNSYLGKLETYLNNQTLTGRADTAFAGAGHTGTSPPSR